jgi:hypothetical protein
MGDDDLDLLHVAIIEGMTADTTRFIAYDRAVDRDTSVGGAPRIKWWRWGRVELPVQNPSPGTTTSVSDGLSSTARTGIGTLPDGPVTCP